MNLFGARFSCYLIVEPRVNSLAIEIFDVRVIGLPKLLPCQKERGYGSLFPEPVRERNYDPDAASPRSSCLGSNDQKQGSTIGVSDQSLKCRISILWMNSFL